MNTDESGRYSAMYKPFHLIGLEVNISIISAALKNKPTGSNKKFVGDVIATAKRNLKAGEVLDGEGGFTIYGTLMSSAKSLQIKGLPIGLSENVKLKVPIPKGEFICWRHVETDKNSTAFRLRREMEKVFATDEAI